MGKMWDPACPANQIDAMFDGHTHASFVKEFQGTTPSQAGVPPSSHVHPITRDTIELFWVPAKIPFQRRCGIHKAIELKTNKAVSSAVSRTASASRGGS